jgi:outer membrane lipoprotein SlyB
MKTGTKPDSGSNVAVLGAGVLMVICCAVGPAVIGAVAGSAIGGWLGIVCAVILAALIGLLLHRRARTRQGC